MRVHHHVCLRRKGGATKMARTLITALARIGVGSNLSYEIDEPGPAGEAQDVPETRPESRVEAAGLGEAGSGDDILHLHTTAARLAALSALQSRKGRVVATVHDCSFLTGGCVYPVDCPFYEAGCPQCPYGYPEPAAERAARRDALARLDPLCVSPSAWLARQMRQAYPGLTVKVVPNGVDIPEELADKAKAKAELGVAERARVALFLAHGGLKAGYKGGPEFPALWGAIKQAVPDAVGFVVGGNECSRDGDLICWPYLTGSELARIFAASDVMVYPAQADNHPLVVLEAMANGLAVASYAVGGIPEQIPDEGVGLLAAPGDETGLVRLAASLLASPAKARSIGLAARQRCLDSFSAARMAAAYARLYASLAGGGEKNG